MNVLKYEEVDLQVTPAVGKCQYFRGLCWSLERQSDARGANSEKITRVVCHRYQLHEYNVGDVYVLRRTIKKPEDYTAPKLRVSCITWLGKDESHCRTS